MKKILCLLLAFVFLFSLAACTTTEGETSDEPSTSAPAESTASAESGDVTEPEETTSSPSETTDPTESFPSTFNIVDGVLVWDETQFPTITSIKIGPNTLTNPDPTEEELSNFLCEVLFYSISFEWTGYMTPYRIPWDDSVTYAGEHGLEHYRFDMDYIKSRQYMESVVIDSYFDASYYEKNGFFVMNGVNDEGISENIYIYVRPDDEDWEPLWDPTLFNYVVTKKTDTEMSVDICLYSNTSSKTSDCKITMVYTDDHLWKVTDFKKPKSGGQYKFAPREDFGTRLTIEKAD